MALHKQSLLIFWLRNARWVALPQSFTPALAGAVMAGARPGFSVILAIVSIVGVCMAHLSLNLFDDYFDYRKSEPGVRNDLSRAGMRARTGKCDYLISGQATLRQLLMVAFIFGGLAGLCGIVVFIYRGAVILGFVVITALLGIAYSADPLGLKEGGRIDASKSSDKPLAIKALGWGSICNDCLVRSERVSSPYIRELKNHHKYPGPLGYIGLGELTLGFIFGPMLVSGVYLASGGLFSLESIIVGLALGLLVANILYTHSLLDLDADKSVGKLTLAGLISTPEKRLGASFFMMFLPYVIILFGIVFRVLSVWYLLTLLTLPLAVALLRSLIEFVRYPNTPVSPKKWYGPMTRWDEITAEGIDWFMLRWYLARNLITAFSAIVILAAFLR
ncbi:MAG: prenyltransferase [Oscillospiraceae bacterium]|nr:prenyltransferase [Oscillospiraceae bacterium]